MLSLSPPPSAGPLTAAAAAAAASATTRCFPSSSHSSSSSHLNLTTSLSPKRTFLLSKPNTTRRRRTTLLNPTILAVAKTDAAVGGPPSSSASSSAPDDVVLVGEDAVPVEGVIQFEKPNSNSRVQKWGRIALLAGGDVMGLVLFAAIGRFSHGFSVFDVETLRTADPFLAGWFLSAYFLGGYDEDGRGMNGWTKAIMAAAKSWALGIPLGVGIRAATLGHLPPMNFISVTMGSTAVLLIGWRALFFRIFGDAKGKDDVYKRGSPFELFELLTSLVRRW